MESSNFPVLDSGSGESGRLDGDHVLNGASRSAGGLLH